MFKYWTKERQPKFTQNQTQKLDKLEEEVGDLLQQVKAWDQEINRDNKVNKLIPDTKKSTRFDVLTLPKPRKSSSLQTQKPNHKESRSNTKNNQQIQPPKIKDFFVIITKDTKKLPSEVVAFLIKTQKIYLDSGVNVANSKELSIIYQNPWFKTHEDKNSVTWYILEEVLGSGSFGIVYSSSLKLTIDKKTLEMSVTEINDVVKIQKIEDPTLTNELLELAQKEAQQLKKHKIRVELVALFDNQIYTVMENCGPSLRKIIKSFNENTSFDDRLKYALRFCNELLMLNTSGVVHRDLKPDNICCLEKKYEKFELLIMRVIDFGLAINMVEASNVAEVCGTKLYMSPELRVKGEASYASDIWACMLIMLEIFGANNLFKDVTTEVDLVKDKMCLDGLFKNIPDDIDPILLKELKELFLKGLSYNPNERPTINLVYKFMSAIANRRNDYRQFQLKEDFVKREKLIATKFAELEKLYQEIGITRQPITLDEIKTSNTGSIIQGFKSYIHEQREEIEKNFFKSKLVAPSHFSLIEQLIKEGKTVDDYPKEIFSNNTKSQGLALAQDIILKAKNDWTAFKNKFISIDNAFKSNKFKGTNSSGISAIIEIMKSQDNFLNKLTQLKAIGELKTKKGLSNWYSKSHLFGQGRHKNIDELYQKLASVTFTSDSSNTKQELEKIEQYINQNVFLHK